ncbi:MAG: hypothetical protein AAGF60_02455 [Pseudomonadota bacterium]
MQIATTEALALTQARRPIQPPAPAASARTDRPCPSEVLTAGLSGHLGDSADVEALVDRLQAGRGE